MNTMKQLGVGVISQSRLLWKVLLFLYLPIVLLFLAVGLLSRLLDDLTLSLLMRDIVTTGRLPFFTGLVPQLEGVLWSASLTVCVIGWVVLKRRGGDVARSKRFLLQLSVVTAILLLDDIFLFHGEIAPKHLHIGKNIVLSIYLLTIGVFVYSNRLVIFSSEYLILMLALGLFGASVLLDLLPLQMFSFHRFVLQLRVFLEDGLKFAGIATWLTYFARYTVQQIESTSRTHSH